MARNLDMFSFLPDSLLFIIISLLPYKEAARTSILSKRWLEAWRDSTKVIEFNELFFVKPGESDESKEAQRRAFLNFITHWISNYTNQVVDKFSLKVSDPESCHEIIERCVAFAAQRGVKELRLDFSDPNWKEDNWDDHSALMQLPQHVYELGSSSLESLKLYSCSFSMPNILNFKTMPNILNFRSLKEISLGWIEISETTLKILLHTCKMLENLSLKKCGKLESFDMGEEEVGLKRLVIDKCWLELECILLIAPNLEFFKYSGRVWNSDINVNPDVMEEAEIDFPFEFEPEFIEYGVELSTILSDLYPVKVLTVCSLLLQKDIAQSLLTCKRVFLVMNGKLKVIPSGVESLRRQCDLNDYEPPYNVNLKRYWEELTITPPCLRKTLKVVEIKGCAGSSDEVRACLYLIGVGSVLEEMNVNVMKDEQEETRREVMARYLPGFPRASENLKISIA
ncbi:putative F-box/LRR-repeat protein At1g56400 [Lotus japonicus]|uniref:putative F-box/LRR-repeat protein At1g56400 n=1 Tax=Lotus japonicus TaxID=34305 RepID=UPI00258513D7|nr:putative F-box/LRR-repeat protein At1g56400 [Lotus japonicus]